MTARAAAEATVLSNIVAWIAVAMVSDDVPSGGGCQIMGFHVQIQPRGLEVPTARKGFGRTTTSLVTVLAAIGEVGSSLMARSSVLLSKARSGRRARWRCQQWGTMLDLGLKC
ncbi:hypothetical protein E2562_028650 [Oryza meyeriana var. granulata]|uniref:Secreted protein n=1 Tax=Oryza meyeriana var. granulata TaxID=110450 RepID=A0A6G1BMH4_9ORYZ|nr:hypothetical protein E2562_028650 [Oryza meyeriana var. granulata]